MSEGILTTSPPAVFTTFLVYFIYEKIFLKFFLIDCDNEMRDVCAGNGDEEEGKHDPGNLRGQYPCRAGNDPRQQSEERTKEDVDDEQRKIREDEEMHAGEGEGEAFLHCRPAGAAGVECEDAVAGDDEHDEEREEEWPGVEGIGDVGKEEDEGNPRAEPAKAQHEESPRERGGVALPQGHGPDDSLEDGPQDDDAQRDRDDDADEREQECL